MRVFSHDIFLLDNNRKVLPASLRLRSGLRPSASTEEQERADESARSPHGRQDDNSENYLRAYRRPRISTCLLLLLSLLMFSALAGTQGQAPTQVKPQEVTFQSGKLQLHGFLYKPNGPGPFPALLWNHGSEQLPGWQPALGEFYTSHFYVFFIPHRRGQGCSPGDYIQDLVMKAPPASRAQRMVDLQEQEVEDVVAALNFLKAQSFVDPERIAMSGCSYGGIQTLLAGERDLGIKALVPFAPGAMSWEYAPPLRDRLRKAVDNAKAPILMVQAANDFDLEPSHVLSKEATQKHKDFQSKIYPAFGTTHQDGHGKFCSTGTDVWGADVLAFLAAHMHGPQ